MRHFPLREQHGRHLSLSHVSEPIADIRTLTAALWAKESELVGSDGQEAEQREVFSMCSPYAAQRGSALKTAQNR